MGIDLKEYERLKEILDRNKQRAIKAEGALEQKMKQLKNEWGLTSMKAAEKHLKALRKEEEEAGKAYEKAFTAFQEEWGEKLDAAGS